MLRQQYGGTYFGFCFLGHVLDEEQVFEKVEQGGVVVVQRRVEVDVRKKKLETNSQQTTMLKTGDKQ